MELQIIKTKIHEIRGMRVMLDYDLAQMYGTTTKVLKQSVKRNLFRFPSDFMFELSREEYNSLRSQFVTLENGKGQYSKYLPFAFTEQGVAMLSSVIKSDTAIAINISIMRAFVTIRQLAFNTNITSIELDIIRKQINELIEDVESLNKEHSVYDEHFDDIYLALAQLAQKKKELEPRRRIGY